MNIDKKRVMIIGAVPPPVHGVTLFIKRLISSSLNEKFHLIHFDISDHRDLKNIGEFDLKNICLALIQSIKLMVMCIKKRPIVSYLPLSWGTAGFIRDGLFILILKAFSNSKILFHLHGSYFETFYLNSGFLLKKYISYCLKRAYGAIVLSERLKSIFLRWFPIEKIFVLSNGIDLRFKPRIFDKNKDEVVFSFLGNLYPEKGLFDAVKAFNSVCRTSVNGKLKIAGAWNLKDKYFKSLIENYIEKNDLSDKVLIMGSIYNQDKEDLLLQTDVFLFPSWNEGMPTVIIEAMAAACPIISTKVGAILDLVKDDKNGFLVEVGDVESIAGRIEFFLKSPKRIKEMGQESKKRYNEQFRFHNVVSDFEKMLASL